MSYESVYRLQFRYAITVAVGEAIKAEWARVETAAKTRIRAENLIAEEVTLSTVLERPETYSAQGK